VLIVATVLSYFIGRLTSRPIKRIVPVLDSITNGDFSVNIPQVNSNAELRMLSRSLFRMIEQLRSQIAMRKRHKESFDIILQFQAAIFHSKNLKSAFKAIMPEIFKHFGVYRARLIFVERGGVSRLEAYRDRPYDAINWSRANSASHNKIIELLGNKRYLIYNNFAIHEAHLGFVLPETTSLCILPMRFKRAIRGYIIMEGRDNCIVSDDTVLRFFGRALSWSINWKEAQSATLDTDEDDTGAAAPGAAPAEGTAPVLEEAAAPPRPTTGLRSLVELDVDKGISLCGDEAGYRGIIKIALKNLRSDLEATASLIEKPHDFAIKIHAMKSSLYSIGADRLGDMALEMEKAAKEGQAYSQYWVPYEMDMERFIRELREVALSEGIIEERPMEAVGEELRAALLRAKEAIERQDILKASAALEPFHRHGTADRVMQALDEIDYDAAARAIDEALAGGTDK
jgi:HAMP domain-containing protein/HPt (histidine-containing phosphotransfer) domain-containing protein